MAAFGASSCAATSPDAADLDGMPSAGAAPAVAAPIPERPTRVLFIVVDDLNDWVGCMGGHPNAKTPNIDRLAERGMLFTRAYCPAPMSGPSRTAMLTGRMPGSIGYPATRGTYHNLPIHIRDFAPEAVTLPQRLAAAGFTTYSAGKIFHPADDPASWSDGVLSYHEPSTPSVPAHGNPNIHFDWSAVPNPPDDFGDHQNVAWAVEKLLNHGDGPLFLGVGIFRPHLPWYAPQEFFDLHPTDSVTVPDVLDSDLDDVPAAGRALAFGQQIHQAMVNDGLWRSAVRAYLASISFADMEVGRLLDAVDASEFEHSTAIFLLGDNGFHLGEKTHWTKGDLWEESAHVPLIVSIPGMTGAGTRCERVVSLLDLYPTLLDVLGLEPTSPLEGQSIAPLLKDPAQPWESAALTVVGPAGSTCRTERWRYIRYGDDSEELYDHDADPHEWHNLAADPAQQSVVERFRALLPPVLPAPAPTPTPNPGPSPTAAPTAMPVAP